mmetsp:Transcript_19856/g.29616  ORF Transcript_19856/g.29616 Transcript_19856/m.29616 type:complete len:151 (+) Transcript_19856:597-1049(+)
MLLCKTFLDFPMLRFQFFIAGDTFLFLMTFSPVFWESKRRGHVLIFEMRISEWERDRKDSRSGAVDLQLVGIGCRVGVSAGPRMPPRSKSDRKVYLPSLYQYPKLIETCLSVKPFLAVFELFQELEKFRGTITVSPANGVSRGHGGFLKL